MRDKLSREGRSKLMSKIRSKNTKIEILLRKELRNKNIDYKLHYGVTGKPDLVLPNGRVAIFVDGDFWHGYNWKRLGRIPPKGYWQKKIARTIERDKANTQALRKQGWKVLRFWEHAVEKDLDKCISLIFKALKSRNIYKTNRA